MDEDIIACTCETFPDAACPHHWHLKPLAAAVPSVVPPPEWGKPNIKGPEPDSDPEVFGAIIAPCGCTVRAYSFTAIRDATICGEHSGADLVSGEALLRGALAQQEKP